MTDLNVHHQLAVAALRQYPVQDYDLVFLRHNENLVYRVLDQRTDTSYLLRIHLPRDESFRGLQQTRLAIESELLWLRALKDDTSLIVQSPLLSTAKEQVVMVSEPFTTEAIPCTMLTWIEGVPFSQEGDQAPLLVYRLGVLNARLHEHARTWTPPEPFLRLSYDPSLLQHALEKLYIGVQLGRIAQSDADLVMRAGSYIMTLFERLRRRHEDWGLIHADLLSDNVIMSGERLAPIDFSLCGFGYFWLDMGICLCNLRKPLRKYYLEGYNSPITTEQRHYIEAFTLMMIIVTGMRHLGNEAWQSWFQRRFPVIAREYCPKLLRREEFIYDI